MELYKVLDADGKACHGGTGKWHLPTKRDDGVWAPGEWMPVIAGELRPCYNGYHLCRRQDLREWLGAAIYLAEHHGEMVVTEDKVIVREARLLRRVETWNETTARLFAADCAERVLPIFEGRYAADKRPREAIEAARAFARGKISDRELRAAGDAARDAAWGAAWGAAEDAAEAAARAAAEDAAWAAAGAAAEDAAWAAARAAAWAAAGGAARDAAWDAEREWQTERFFMYLEGKEA